VRLSDVRKVSTAPKQFGRRLVQRQASIILRSSASRRHTVEVVDNAKALLPVFERHFRPSVDVKLLVDRSVSIRNSVSDVRFTLM